MQLCARRRLHGAPEFIRKHDFSFGLEARRRAIRDHKTCVIIAGNWISGLTGDRLFGEDQVATQDPVPGSPGIMSPPFPGGFRVSGSRDSLKTNADWTPGTVTPSS